MAIASVAALIFLVTATSAAEGWRLPPGWLWARMMLAAWWRRAVSTISRG